MDEETIAALMSQLMNLGGAQPQEAPRAPVFNEESFSDAMANSRAGGGSFSKYSSGMSDQNRASQLENLRAITRRAQEADERERLSRLQNSLMGAHWSRDGGASEAPLLAQLGAGSQRVSGMDQRELLAGEGSANRDERSKEAMMRNFVSTILGTQKNELDRASKKEDIEKEILKIKTLGEDRSGRLALDRDKLEMAKEGMGAARVEELFQKLKDMASFGGNQEIREQANKALQDLIRLEFSRMGLSEGE